MVYDWLPDKIIRARFNTDQDYIDALYTQFERDFLATRRSFKGLGIGVKPKPQWSGLFEGKNGTFRHLVTEGNPESARVPQWDRCECLNWVLPIIQHADTPDVHVWENVRTGMGAAWVLMLSDYSYKVVLSQRVDYVLLWTQFPVFQRHSRRKMEREYQGYLAKN